MSKTPKLRFPEFSGEWEEYSIGNVFDFYSTNSYSRDCLNHIDGEVKNIHYGDIHMKFPTIVDANKENIPYINRNISLDKIQTDSYCKDGDVIFADASEDYDDIGKSIEITNIGDSKIVAGLHTILARDNNNITVNGFKGYMLLPEKVRKQIKILSAGAKVLGISKANLVKVKVNIPEKQEQQKIASFLSLVDKKIEKQSEKVEAIKEYKKGMMQKIFSREIRFKDDEGKEFPEWEEKKLGDVCEFRNGKAHEKNICLFSKYVVINSKFISTNGAIKKYSDKNISPLEIDEITMVMSDVPNGRAIAKCFLVNEANRYTLNQRICALRTFKMNTRYLFYYLNRNKYFLKFDDGVNQTNLKKEDILKCPVLVPNITEQQKIANFLSTIDKKLEKEEEKLEALKTWKKGLLQQMFV